MKYLQRLGGGTATQPEPYFNSIELCLSITIFGVFCAEFCLQRLQNCWDFFRILSWQKAAILITQKDFLLLYKAKSFYLVGTERNRIAFGLDREARGLQAVDVIGV